MYSMEGEKSAEAVPFLFDDEEGLKPLKTTIHRRILKATVRWSVFAILICLCVSNAVTYLLTSWSWKRNAHSFCARFTSQSWSPIMKEVDINYSTVTFNGTFFKDSIYRQPPSPEVDEAWRDLGLEYEGIVVPPDEALKSDIALNRASINETYGGPGYPAIVEVFHQLHCLNLLRQSAHFNYDYYVKVGEGPFKHPEKQLRSHVGHCLDMIRQQLMCTADTGLQPFLWVGDPPHPFPDFSRDHKCKNFDDIRRWAQANQGHFEEARFQTLPKGELLLDEVP